MQVGSKIARDAHGEFVHEASILINQELFDKKQFAILKVERSKTEVTSMSLWNPQTNEERPICIDEIKSFMKIDEYGKIAYDFIVNGSESCNPKAVAKVYTQEYGIFHHDSHEFYDKIDKQFNKIKGVFNVRKIQAVPGACQSVADILWNQPENCAV
jgi:hypothetical protein